MERLINHKYRMANHSVSKLIHCGFHGVGYVKDNEYSYRFPVYKYKKKPVLFGAFTVCSDDGHTLVSVYRANGYIFAPFYREQYGNYGKVLNVVQENVKREMAKLGIQKIEKNRRKNDDKRIRSSKCKEGSGRKTPRKKHKK